MDRSAQLRSHRSPKACRNRGSYKEASQTAQFPHRAVQEDDWETDPDYINDGSRQCGGRQVSTASIISDLSRSIRECSLRKSVPDNTEEYTDHHSHLCKYKDFKGLRTPLCPRVRSSPDLGIERSSVFNRNVAETLDTFFSEKIKAWANDDAQLSDIYENMETPQGQASHGRCWRGTAKAAPGQERMSRRQNSDRPVPARGAVVDRACSSWDNYEPGEYCSPYPQHVPQSKGELPGSLREKQEGRSLSTAVRSSARILPQCRISHVQSCEACQAFNQEMPAGNEASYGECRLPRYEEGTDRGRVTHRKGRTSSSSQRQLCKVQQWLEQSPVDERPKAEKHTEMALARSEATCGSPEPKERDPWGRAGDAGDYQSLENPAEPRHRRKVHKARHPGHQPVARIVTCDDTRPSPGACSCLFCERQKGHPRSGKREGKKGVDPSAQEVALQLQAENRVPRIVEAFERRSLREAKIAERDRIGQTSHHRDSEKRARAAKSQGDGKRGHPSQGAPKARKSCAEEEEAPRPGTAPEERPKQHQGKGHLVGKRPSFMDRLRGLY